VNRYLPELPIPAKAKLGLNPKGTGKTQLLEGIVSQALAREQWVLVIGHRVRLVGGSMPTLWAELCHRSATPTTVMRYGLVDFPSRSQARFNAVNWLDGVVLMKSNKSSGTG